LGIINVCPLQFGKTSKIAIKFSSSQILKQGISPLIILQKIQSFISSFYSVKVDTYDYGFCFLMQEKRLQVQSRYSLIKKAMSCVVSEVLSH
jgi:hypothetical protein